MDLSSLTTPFIIRRKIVINKGTKFRPWAALASSYTPPSNTPTGRKFFGGFLMGGSSFGRVIMFLGGVQQNWADQCEIVGGVGLPCPGANRYHYNFSSMCVPHFL